MKELCYILFHLLDLRVLCGYIIFSNCFTTGSKVNSLFIKLKGKCLKRIFLPSNSVKINFLNRLLIIYISILLLFTAGCVQIRKQGAIEIARNGRSKYRIVVAVDASPSTMHGAIELQMFLHMMTGAEVPIVSDRLPVGKREIILGNNDHLKRIGVNIDFDKLGDEGYVLRTSGKHLVIAGGELRGNMYGVYGLLEDHLGCRWFTPEVSHIPLFERLEIPPLDETNIPVLEYREPYVWEAFDGDWAARNRMNRNSKDGGLGVKHGGRIEWVPDMFVHTFEKLVPPEKYFRQHPEYFSLVGRRRLRKRSQLCSTNEDVVRIVTEGVLEAFRKNPQAYVISVSQNDWGNYCECPKCSALAENEGSQIAPIIQMVNRVAEEVEKEFPGRMIETLAYQWSRKAPKTIRPRHNVVIRLSTIECCFSHPLESCDSPENIEFANDIREWSKTADRLWVWNYMTSFTHYFVPFPNLRVRDDNIRFFVNNNVKGIFQQDVYTTPFGELSELSGYLNAKLLWNPDYDEDTAINEFLAGVYGPAAGPIREYIDIIHDKVEDDNIHIGIWQGPDAEYLTDEILTGADSLWAEAETALEDMPEVLERVRIARLSVDYAIIARDRNRGDAYIVDHEKYRLYVNPSFNQRVERFCNIAENAGVIKLREYNFTVDEFREDIEKTIKARNLEPVNPANSVQTSPGLVYRYFEGEWTKLPRFDRIKPQKTGRAEQFKLPFEGNGETYGYTFKGYIKIQRDGVYTFYTRSDGYSSISIGVNRLVNNGGRDPIRERSGFIALKSGEYPIELTFFSETGGKILEVYYEGPGMKKQEIPAVNLRSSKL